MCTAWRLNWNAARIVLRSSGVTVKAANVGSAVLFAKWPLTTSASPTPSPIVAVLSDFTFRGPDQVGLKGV
jgi:hypothetical protein